MELIDPISAQAERVQQAFSQQAIHYDADDIANPVLQQWRNRVYKHVENFIPLKSKILELNAGTGIDALYFASKGHQVHATDASDGMIDQIRKKIAGNGALALSCQSLNYEALHTLSGSYDFVFSNFGGLNCSKDLTSITKRLPALVKPGGFVTLVIMPPLAPWEWTWVLKGKFHAAFRRLTKNGAIAHLEGEYFRTYYYSLRSIRKAFGSAFKLLKTEGLGSLSPPPSATRFIRNHPAIHRRLESLDYDLRNTFPFNRWADHLVITFQRGK